MKKTTPQRQNSAGVCPTENEEAEIFATWLSWQQRCGRLRKFTHVANEKGAAGKSAIIAAVRKKRMGVSPGVPDFMIVTYKRLIFVELKRQRGGSLKPEQKEWLDALAALGVIETCVARGAEEAITFVEKFL